MQKRIPAFLTGFLLLTVFGIQQSSAQYCVPDYYTGTGSGDYCDGFELGDISNFTGPGLDYNDYTDLSTLLIPGLSYTLTIYNCPSYTEYYAVWIDWDQNEIFATSEKLGGADIIISAGGTGTITFTVPVTAVSGTTRLRLRCVYYPPGAISACATTYSYGEVEDYSVFIPTPTDYNVGVTDIDMETACGLGMENITVTVTNIGEESVSDFDISYYYDDPVSGLSGTVTEAYAGSPIPSFGSVDYTFTTPADLSNVGDYTLWAFTSMDLDTVPADDTTFVTFTNIPVISTFPYFEDFEEGTAGWTQYGISSSWELGSPSAAIISGAPPATPGSENSWATNVDGNYNSYETSYVESPCMDFSSLVLPYMELDIWWDTYAFNDGAQLEYSTDAGATWTLLGDIGTGDNWYTTYGYSLGYDPMIPGYEPGWVGSGGGWKTAHHDIAFLAGESSVKIRIKFASTWYPIYNGIAFDNILIQDPLPDDVAVTAFASPMSAVDLSASEVVAVEITNLGTNTQTSIPVRYQVDGGAVVSETWTGSLAAGETTVYSFSVPYDMSSDGDYNYCAWTALPGDEDISNDTLCDIIKNLAPISGTEAYYIHLSTTDPFSSSDNVDKMDEVFGDGGWIEEYFDTMDPDEIFDEGTCFIYLEGGGSTAIEFATFLTNNGATVENWVASGGNLFLNAAPEEGGNINVGFGSTSFLYPNYIYYAESTEPDFDIISTPYTPVGTDWTGWWYNFAHAKITGTGLTKLIEDYYTPSTAICSFKEWGDGMVVFGTMTPAEYCSPIDEVGNIRKNIFELLKYCSPVDVGVVDLILPEDGCGLGTEETIEVAIENFGPTAVSSLTVKYVLDGGPVVTEVATVVVDPGGTEYYTFDATGDFSALGTHTLEVWTDIYVDQDHSNDTLYLELETLEAAVVDLGDDKDVCDSVSLDALNPGMFYYWNTGETTQVITATEPGDYWVLVTHPVTGCVKSDTVEVDLTYTPDASFDFTMSGYTLDFINTSSPGADYTWYFGDGGISSEDAPVHTFGVGVYTVVLVAENNCGYSAFDTIIYVGVDAIDAASLENMVLLYPNPSMGTSVLNIHLDQAEDLRYEIYNATGQLVSSRNLGMVSRINETIHLEDQPSGIYQVKVFAGEEQVSKDLIIIR